MGIYKTNFQNYTDEQLLDLLEEYSGHKMDRSDPEWNATVVAHIRDDGHTTVEEDGDVHTWGDEHYNFFGEFVYFKSLVA